MSDEAFEIAKLSVTLFPEDDIFIENLGNCYAQRNLYRESEPLFQKLVQLLPNGI